MNAPPAPAMPIAVDPNAMVTVVLDPPGGARVINAISCRYVPAPTQFMLGGAGPNAPWSRTRERVRMR